MRHLIDLAKDQSGSVRSLDGARTVSLEEFDRLFDEGSDEIDAFVDWSKARAVYPDEEPVVLYLRSSTLAELDCEAAREGTSRERLMEQWIDERLGKKPAKSS